jgi:hypothetical protein
MAIRFYVTVTTSPSVVVPAKTGRLSVAVQNTSSTETLFLDFGVDPAANSGAWRIAPGATIVLAQSQFPEVTQDIRLVATGTCNVIIRDSVD